MEELNACGNLGCAYFYDGDLEKAHHYIDRMISGKLESEESILKKITNKMILSKRKEDKYPPYQSAQ